MTRYTSEKPSVGIKSKPALAIVATMGVVSFVVSVVSANTFGADMESVAFGAVNVNPTIGQKERPIVFEKRVAPWMSEFVVDGAMENVTLPTTFTGTFPHPPLRSLYFTENGIAYYAYLFPIGRGEEAQNAIQPSEHHTGEQGIARRGDVIVISIGAGRDVANAMAEKLSPSCQTSPNSITTDIARTLENGATPPQHRISIQGEQPTTQIAQGSPGVILPEKFVKSIALEQKNESTPPPHPGNPPKPHATANISNTITIKEPDIQGPGCGWEFFGATSPMENETYVSDINSSNKATVEKRTQEYNDEIRSFNEKQLEYVKEWNEWKKKAEAWVKWQNEIIKLDAS